MFNLLPLTGRKVYTYLTGWVNLWSVPFRFVPQVDFEAFMRMIVVAGKEVVPPCRDVHHDDRRRETMKFYLGNKRI